ncbi:MAG: gamma-glutamyltransferase [Verrucomicrobia bacterium]|nr:gamma-glutamyltransferase [Verrucomicrobiota bacterium]
MNHHLRTLLIPLLALSMNGRAELPTQTEDKPLSPPGKYSCEAVERLNGMVVSVSGPASAVGRSILQQGGNAVDAAVATAFALVAAYPPAGNLGGGGFMLVHPAPGEGKPVAFNYRETAPAAARQNMFTREDSQYTHKAVAVPGTVRGLALAHQRFGSLPWANLLAPAVALARDGFIVDPNLADLLNTYLADSPDKAEFQRVFGKPGGDPWQEGDRLVQPDLARTLELIATGGPNAFYTGPIAEQIVAEMERGKGIITAEDLAGYRAVEGEPLSTRYRGRYDVYVPPPPSAGGICLLEELNILQNFDLQARGRWSPETLHVMAEAMRRANCDRARYVGDPAFVQIPGKLTCGEYGQQLAEAIDLHQATRSRDLAPDIPVSDEGLDTTHFSIIDQRGMAVANTYTLERLWGTRIVVKDMGFLLNNNMFGFNLFSGFTRADGKLGTAPNTIAPGKRPISSQTPTIVTENGRIRLVTGTPGSQGIPHTILCLIVNLFDFGMPVQSAVELPRLSHQWLPDQLQFEAPERYPELMRSLQELGHTVVRYGPRPQGDAQTVWVSESGSYVGVADTRRSIKAKAEGY